MNQFSFNLVLFSFLFVISNQVFSSVNCPAAKVEYIQIEGSKILLHPENQQWHLLGNPETLGAREKYSAVLAAQMAGKNSFTLSRWL